MKTSTRLAAIRTAAAALLLVTALDVAAHAQGKPALMPPPRPGGKSGRPHLTPEQMAQHEFDRLQKVTGKPLTPPQKAALVSAYMTRRAEQKAASDKFDIAAAKTLGIPVDVLKKKYRAVMDAERAATKGKLAGGAPPMPAKR